MMLKVTHNDEKLSFSRIFAANGPEFEQLYHHRNAHGRKKEISQKTRRAHCSF
jgi:hypothetical protein